MTENSSSENEGNLNDDQEPDSSLALVITEELIKELSRRFDALCILGYRDMTNSTYGVVRRWKGSPYTVLGLIQTSHSAITAATLTSEQQSE